MQTWQHLSQNPGDWDRYLVKSEIIRAIRNFFETQGYRELESPILSPTLPAEAYLDFLSLPIGRDTSYLIPTTERYNKLALAAGLGSHFVISKVFRDSEKIGPNHSPEFTMLEWYHLAGTSQDLMRDCEQMLQVILKRLGKESHFTYQGQAIDFSPNWPKFSVAEMFAKYADINLAEVMQPEKMRAAIQKLNLINNPELLANTSWQDMFDLIFFNLVEPNLPADRPAFVYDYPHLLCPHAAPNDDGFTGQKAELYIAGKEVANGYTELRDAAQLEHNLREQYELRKQAGKPLAPFDTELIKAIETGIPPVAGMGMGIDRLTMILADAQNMSEINLFPFGE